MSGPGEPSATRPSVPDPLHVGGPRGRRHRGAARGGPGHRAPRGAVVVAARSAAGLRPGSPVRAKSRSSRSTRPGPRTTAASTPLGSGPATTCGPARARSSRKRCRARSLSRMTRERCPPGPATPPGLAQEKRASAPRPRPATQMSKPQGGALGGQGEGADPAVAGVVGDSEHHLAACHLVHHPAPGAVGTHRVRRRPVVQRRCGVHGSGLVDQLDPGRPPEQLCRVDHLHHHALAGECRAQQTEHHESCRR